MKHLQEINNASNFEPLVEDKICDLASSNRLDSIQTVQVNKLKTVSGLVSVIMPVFNTDKELLKAAIQSVQRQTYHNLELIIVDDGSEIQCADFCDNIADNRTKVIHIKNSGVSAARNKGIDESLGEYIAFIDSDDTIADNTIEVMVAQSEGVDFVACGCRHIKSIGLPFSAEMQGDYILDQFGCIECLCYMDPKYNHIESNAVWGKLYRRDLVDNLRFDTNIFIAEDFCFNFEYIMKSKSGKYLDFLAYNYLEHIDSISRVFKPKMIKTINKLDCLICENKDTSIYAPLISRCVNIAFTILMMIPKNEKDYKKKIERFINMYRGKVLKNTKSKRKVKLAVVTSYLGYGFTRMIFDLNRR